MVFHRSRGAGGMEISFQNLLFIQCDQMAKLFFNIWPFTIVELCSLGITKLPKLVQKFWLFTLDIEF